MYNPAVQQLNRRLGERLGFVRGGMMPRFQWMWAPELPFWQKHFGKVWVMCEWKKPASLTVWLKEFGDRYPYPENGMYFAFGDTQLQPGTCPTPEMNQNYIWALDRQMSTTFSQHMYDVKSEVADQKHKHDTDWFDYTQGFAPAFDHWDAGKRGGSISFGGV